MKKYFVTFSALLLGSSIAMAQKINFEEYDLPNGLHVILHQDNSAPVVTTTVMYHVGAKDDLPGKSGFAHFFEHLLFEGRISQEVAGSISFPPMVGITMPLPMWIRLITTRPSLPIACSLPFGWKPSVCYIL